MAVTGKATGVRNAGIGHSVTLLELAAALEQVSGVTQKINYAPATPEDIRFSSMDPAHLSEIFGEPDLLPLREELRRLWEAEE